MTSIQRPGGPSGPSGPSGPAGPDGADGPDALDGAETATGAGGPDAVAAAGTAASGDAVAELARAVDAGAVAPQAALDQLIEQAVAGLPADQAAEVRAAMTDALAHDPYLAGLARELGVASPPGGLPDDPSGGAGA